MAILELIFKILKTIFLSTIYSTIVLLILVLVGKYNRNNWLKKRLSKKLRFWLLTHFLISVGLFFFSFKYTLDTGIGDNSIIPIGFGQTIQNEDFQTTYFYPDLTRTDPNNDAIVITNYVIVNDKICAEVSYEFTNHPSFKLLVFDLTTQTLKTFENESEYNNYANTNNLPLRTKFYNFEQHFKEYLAERPFWKTWLLP